MLTRKRRSGVNENLQSLADAEAQRWINAKSDPPWLVMKFVSSDVGYGVFTTKSIDPGAFIVYYAGELITAKEGLERERTAGDSSVFRFFLNWHGKRCCIDATEETGRMGRLVNHSKNYMAHTRVVVVGGVPHICIFATRKIFAGEQITYDYMVPLPFKDKLTNTKCMDVNTKTKKSPTFGENLSVNLETIQSIAVNEQSMNVVRRQSLNDDTDLSVQPDIESMCFVTQSPIVEPTLSLNLEARQYEEQTMNVARKQSFVDDTDLSVQPDEQSMCVVTQSLSFEETLSVNLETIQSIAVVEQSMNVVKKQSLDEGTELSVQPDEESMCVVTQSPSFEETLSVNLEARQSIPVDEQSMNVDGEQSLVDDTELSVQPDEQSMGSVTQSPSFEETLSLNLKARQSIPVDEQSLNVDGEQSLVDDTELSVQPDEQSMGSVTQSPSFESTLSVNLETIQSIAVIEQSMNVVRKQSLDKGTELELSVQPDEESMGSVTHSPIVEPTLSFNLETIQSIAVVEHSMNVVRKQSLDEGTELSVQPDKESMCVVTQSPIVEPTLSVNLEARQSIPVDEQSMNVDGEQSLVDDTELSVQPDEQSMGSVTQSPSFEETLSLNLKARQSIAVDEQSLNVDGEQSLVDDTELSVQPDEQSMGSVTQSPSFEATLSVNLETIQSIAVIEQSMNVVRKQSLDKGTELSVQPDEESMCVVTQSPIVEPTLSVNLEARQSIPVDEQSMNVDGEQSLVDDTELSVQPYEQFMCVVTHSPIVEPTLSFNLETIQSIAVVEQSMNVVKKQSLDEGTELSVQPDEESMCVVTQSPSVEPTLSLNLEARQSIPVDEQSVNVIRKQSLEDDTVLAGERSMSVETQSQSFDANLSVSLEMSQSIAVSSFIADECGNVPSDSFSDLMKMDVVDAKKYFLQQFPEGLNSAMSNKILQTVMDEFHKFLKWTFQDSVDSIVPSSESTVPTGVQPCTSSELFSQGVSSTTGINILPCQSLSAFDSPMFSSDDETMDDSSPYLPPLTDEENSNEEINDGEIRERVKSCNVAKGQMVTEDMNQPVSSSVRVDISKKRIGGRRVWDKKSYCIYCDCSYGKLARHLSKMHHAEVDVQKALSMPKKSKERLNMWTILRNRGNYRHNADVIKTGEGVIVPSKRSQVNTSAKDVLPCAICLGLFNKKRLWKHVRKCRINHSNASEAVSSLSERPVAAGRALLPLTVDVSVGLKVNVLSNMKEDGCVSLTVKNDPLILKFGDQLYYKYGNKPHLHSYISTKLRELGRFLVAVRLTGGNPTASLTQFIHPSQFPAVIKAVQNVAGFDDVSCHYLIPSLALKIGHSLRRCAEIKEAQGLMDSDPDMRQAAEDFLKLCCSLWSAKVGSHAVTTLSDKSYNKTQILPVAGDLQKLQVYLEKSIETHVSALNNCPNPEAWCELAKAVETNLVLFNRRRSGEVQRLTLTDYQHINNNPVESGLLKCFTPVEQKLASLMKRIEIKGKKGRKVSLLVTTPMSDAIDLLNATRLSVGVPETNNHVFANIKSKKNRPIRSCDSLREAARICGATCPSNLTSTKLRKHIASMSQVLNLKDHELDMVAKFLGHNIDIHREFYRLPNNTLEITRVSKLLMAMNNGCLTKYAGKKLEDIDPFDMDDAQNVSGVEIESETEASDTSQSDDETLTLSSTSFPPLNQETKTPSLQLRKKGPPINQELLEDDETLKRSSTCSQPLNQETITPSLQLRRKGPPVNQELWDELKRSHSKRRKEDDDEDYEPPRKVLRKTSNTKRRQPDEDETSVEPQEGNKRQASQKQPWTPLQQQVVQKEFKRYFCTDKLPGKWDIERCIAENPCLSPRTWKNVKDFIRNSKKCF